MFQDFWEKNKSVIEFVGIICGVGALFLAIPSSGNAAAQKALANIQFMWLIFIAVSIIFFFLNLYWYSYQQEQRILEKYGFQFEIRGSISYLMMGFTITFIVSIWQYASALYPQPLRFFGGIILGVLIFLIASVVFYFLRKLKDKMNDWIYALVDSLVLAVATVAAAVTINLLSYNARWPWWQYLLSAAAILLFGVFFKIITDYRRKRAASNAEQATIKEAE